MYALLFGRPSLFGSQKFEAYPGDTAPVDIAFQNKNGH
jgi:hypothetical protein